MTSFDQLPFEILSIIFSHVDGNDLYDISLINRTMRMAVQPRLRWWRTHCRIIKRGKFYRFLEELRMSHQQQQPSLGQQLRSLEFHVKLSDRNLLDVMQYVGAQLEELIIRNGHRLTNTSLQPMPRHYPHLKLFHLEHARVTGWSMEALGHHCLSLTHLTLLDCPRLRVAQLVLTMTRCSLTHLLFDRCQANEMLHKQGTHLELHGSGSWIHHMNPHRGPYWPELTSLSIRGFSGEAIVRFIGMHRHLTHLTMQSAWSLDAIAKVLSRVILVVHLRWHPWLTASAIRRFVRRCPSLTRLSLHECDMTVDDFPDFMGADQRPWVVRYDNVLPNFTGLGRHKINLIRHHSSVDDTYRQ
ncbi:unnamed protein product [Absidia cylindrospora]